MFFISFDSQLCINIVCEVIILFRVYLILYLHFCNLILRPSRGLGWQLRTSLKMTVARSIVVVCICITSFATPSAILFESKRIKHVSIFNIVILTHHNIWKHKNIIRVQLLKRSVQQCIRNNTWHSSSECVVRIHVPKLWSNAGANVYDLY